MNLDNYQKFIESLDPKTAAEVKTAATTETRRFPLASEGLTRVLNGGIGAGRITLCYGNTSSGKSLLFMQSVALWQAMGLVCCWVDVEGTYEKEWGARLGIDNDRLILIQTKSAGRIEKQLRPFLEKGIDVVVIDSISDIMPEVFFDKKGNLNDQANRVQLGAHAKAITGLINGILYLNERTAIVLISQTTTEIGQNYVKQIPHGGKKTLFAASQIIKLTSSSTDGQQIKDEVQVGGVLMQVPVARDVNAYVEKNKLGPQGQSVDYDLYYAGPQVGIDAIGEVVDFAEAIGIVVLSGAWYKYDGQSHQGRPTFIKYLRQNPEVLQKIKDETNMMLTGEIREPV